MRVTDLDYPMEKRLIAKLDLMIDRCTGKRKFDNLLIIDGDEGYGKTNMAKAVAYYIAHTTGRPFNLNHMFFDVDAMINFAQTTQDQVIVWDESALEGLASEWQNKTQKKLIKLLMVARKKRHVWIFNIPKYFKLNEYLVADRCIGLIHVYARHEKQLGRFTYYKKKNLQSMYYQWKRKRARGYKRWSSFHGTFPDMTDKIYLEEDYDKLKDKAILSVTESPKKSVEETKLLYLKYKISQLKKTNKSELMRELGIERTNLVKWNKIPLKHPEILEMKGLVTDYR